jgi:hypothetical protein
MELQASIDLSIEYLKSTINRLNSVRYSYYLLKLGYKQANLEAIDDLGLNFEIDRFMFLHPTAHQRHTVSIFSLLYG